MAIEVRDWKKRFLELQAFRREHGHCKVPLRWPENPGLAHWVLMQRHRPGQLSPNQAGRLYQIGFPFGWHLRNWLAHFVELMAFQKAHGHCRVPQGWRNNPSLAKWVGHQRGIKSTMPMERHRWLDAIGFTWKVYTLTDWNTRFSQLEAFQHRFGHCKVPRIWPSNPQLSKWVTHQRENRDELRPERRASLDRIAFDWSPYASAWEQKFRELIAYRKTHGHCNVPVVSKANPSLGLWAANQRAKRQRLSTQRRRRLDQLGFDWHPLRKLERQWNRRLTELKAFRRRHGHCYVPENWPANPKLGVWVGLQRHNRQRLSAHRIATLDALDFEWRPRRLLEREQWNQLLSELKAFRRQFGHCNVPRHWKNNPTLSQWVAGQRANQDRLRPAQRKQLDRIGFEWQPSEQRAIR